jgi:hypothetical protein
MNEEQRHNRVFFSFLMTSKQLSWDPLKWSLVGIKPSTKDSKDPPGYSFLNEKSDFSVLPRGAASNQGILEKV